MAECHHCGSRMRDVTLQPGESLRCGLCKSTVRHRRRSDPFQTACAFSLSGLLFLALGNIYPIMTFSVAGNTQANQIITGVKVLLAQGYWPIALLVFFCAMLAPLLYFSGVAYISLACALRRGLPFVNEALVVVRRVQPWSLVPVFAMACFVAVVKLDLIGNVEWQAGILWIALLAGCTLVLESFFDARLAKETLESLK